MTLWLPHSPPPPPPIHTHSYYSGTIKYLNTATVWHKIFAGVYFWGLATFCVLRELIFAIRTDWFFLLGINFCNLQKVPST